MKTNHMSVRHIIRDVFFPFVQARIDLAKQKPLRVAMVALIYLLVKNLTGSFLLAFFVSFFLLSWILRIESRIALGWGLMMLLGAPLYLLVGREGRAEDLALYAYYFLIAGVTLQFLEYRQEEAKGGATIPPGDRA